MFVAVRFWGVGSPVAHEERQVKAQVVRRASSVAYACERGLAAMRERICCESGSTSGRAAPLLRTTRAASATRDSHAHEARVATLI